MQISGSDSIESTLKNYFGYTSFLPLQQETITSTMAGENVLAVAGTGGGKSLMYLFPAVLSSKVTMVISPLKSLIDDSLIRCLNLNISACKFTGDVPLHTRTEQVDDLKNYRVIFTWGSTFRPKYITVCQSLSGVDCPKLLLSATISANVESNVRSTFGNFKLYRTSLFRDNLNLEVIERTSKFMDELVKCIQEMESQKNSGIIYGLLPRDVSHIHTELVKRGVKTVKYHGQLSDAIKSSDQAKWMNDEVKVMVANSSFGMGIDKGNVTYLVHAKQPSSVVGLAEIACQ